jgi:DNA-binding CsgD family transcriptional regulator
LTALEETAEPVATQPLVEPLSERELEMLPRVAVGLSNREIAEELYLSTNTVKVHTNHVYSRLNVHSQMQAAERARGLGLFTLLNVGQDRQILAVFVFASPCAMVIPSTPGISHPAQK